MHTTASKITMLRMILIPVFLIFLYLDMRYWALAVFIIASASDAVDGYIARHYNQVTNFGKFMDPLADKVLVITAMCYYIEAQQMAAWVVAIVIFREFAVSGLRRDCCCKIRKDKDYRHNGCSDSDAGHAGMGS